MIYLTLFYEFFKIGLFSIGGGLATLPFLYDLIDRYHWFSSDMLLDMIAISQSTPGPIGVNMSTYAGFVTAGIPGSIIATLGIVTPSVIIIIIIAKFLSKFNENKYVKSAFYGLRPAVTALIALAAYEVIKVTLLNIDTFTATGNILKLINLKATILFFLFLIAIRKFKVHPIIYITLGAFIGIIFRF
nr:chromate transporter [uncultured Cellulosilyticum sp.]